MEVYKNWLKCWFAQKGSLPETAEDENYFQIGLIDSFGVIELIEELETTFSITFTEAHFQDRRFVTMKGLAEIIQEIKKAQNGS